jgi:thioredoxin-dependent peroxiredoxin
VVEEGKPAPDFKLESDAGETISLASLRGKPVVLYFYPKDDTPGCTIQGKAFTATKADFDGAGAVVAGLSADDTKSHKDFCNKFGFSIELLADPGAKLLSALNAGQSEYKGTMYWDRTTFLVDPTGVVRKVYTKVDPNGHEKVVLDDIAKLKAA